MNMQEIADELTAQFYWNKFSFGANNGSEQWKFRYLTSCILVGGSLESKTLECAKAINDAYPRMEDLAVADITEVAEIIRSHGVRFHGPKSKYITNTAKILLNKFNGEVPNNRTDLESLPGVARHVASVILATVFDQNEFAVDVHVRRIAGRLGVTGTDREIEDQIREAVNPAQWGHFSRSFVDFGQTKCSHSPDCTGCKFASFCGSVKFDNVAIKAPVLDVENYTIEKLDGKYKFTKSGSESSCYVNYPALKCSCNGFRFKRTCKHIGMARDII